MRNVLITLVAAAALTGRPLAGQDLGKRIAATPDGETRMSFANRPDVCGNGNGYTRKGHGTSTWNDGKRDNDVVVYDAVEYDSECRYPNGPVNVLIVQKNGRVTKVRTWVGGRWREGRTGNDLGRVSASAAARALLAIANDPANGSGGKDAVFPATIADSIDISPELLKVAKNSRIDRETRKSAVFWLSQAAGDSATVGLAALVGDEAEESDVRKSAVFALSQRPKDEGVPALIRIAKTNKDPEVRRSAIFWLGQSEDPRALGLIEDLILRN
jgi:hypothetical protein